MAFSATFSHNSFSCISSFHQTLRRNPIRFPSFRPIRAASEPENEAKTEVSSNAQPSSSTTATTKLPKKPVYSMKKGQIVRVDKEKYLNSINHQNIYEGGLRCLVLIPVPISRASPYYKGLDYIYEDRGEVLDLRIFETGEYALVAWVGIPTAPAWLPTDMLIKSEKLNYERL